MCCCSSVRKSDRFLQRLIDVARKLDKADRQALALCAHHLKRLEQYAYCVEVFNKMGDKKAIVKLHVDTRNWDEVTQAVVVVTVHCCRSTTCVLG